MGISISASWLIMLLFVPLVGYWIDRPEAVKIDNKKLAADGLAKLGPMKHLKNLGSCILFLLLVGWLGLLLVTNPSIAFDLSPTAVALVAYDYCILLWYHHLG